MDWKLIIGLMAAAGTTIAFLPQAIKTMKTKQTKDISLWMYILFTTGVYLWLTYGLLIKDPPIIIANIITAMLATTILALKVKHG